MASWMRNQIANLYNAISAPVAATQDRPTERLQSARNTASLLYNRMMDNISFGQERLKKIVEWRRKPKGKIIKIQKMKSIKHL